MTRQIQIRRGTATENDAFTGAVGEVTMDTTNNTLRVHDGTTPGGTVLAKKSEIPSQQTLPDNYDFVVESQLPTAANNYTWYRKYKSGWVDQGGIITSNSDADINITYPFSFADTNYTLVLGLITQNDGTAGLQWSGAKSISTTGFTARVNSTVRKCWATHGVAAK